MALKWTGKTLDTSRGNPEPLGRPAEYSVPCQDLTDEEVKELAAAHGQTPKKFESSLIETGLWRAKDEPKAPEGGN